MLTMKISMALIKKNGVNNYYSSNNKTVNEYKLVITHVAVADNIAVRKKYIE